MDNKIIRRNIGLEESEWEKIRQIGFYTKDRNRNQTLQRLIRIGIKMEEEKLKNEIKI